MELPTIRTSGTDSGQSSSEFAGSPVYRRQHRKQGSTVFVAPREDAASPAPKVPLNSIVRGVGALAGAQAVAKLVSFFLNQMLLRVISSKDLGQNTQMELFAATALSLSRDAVRFAAVRETLYTKAEDHYHTGKEPVHGTDSGTMQEMVNIGFVPISLGIPLVSLLLGMCWLKADDKIFKVSSSIWAISTVIELMSEPCFLLHQLKLNMGLRARIESTAAILRCMATLVFVIGGQSRMLAFAVGQLVYALGICVGYYVVSYTTWRYSAFKLYFAPVLDEDSNRKIWLNPKISSLAFGMYAQSIFKYLLTESDRLLVPFALTLEKQGEYSVATNYGSLLARLLLFPVEEALRALFAKTLKSNKVAAKPVETRDASSSPVSGSGDSPTFSPHLAPNFSTGSEFSRSRSVNGRTRSTSVSKVVSTSVPMPKQATQKISDTDTAITALTTVLRLYNFLGIIAISVGPYLATFGLRLLLSAAWRATQAPQVLAVYVCYIPVLAWNGCLEAFVQSVASMEDLKRQSWIMFILTITYLIASYVFMKVLNLGAIGLVYAQILNMTLRSAWSLTYVADYFTSNGISSKWILRVFPSRQVSALSIVVLAAAHIAGPITSPQILVVQIGLCLMLVAAFGYSEKEQLLKFLKKK